MSRKWVLLKPQSPPSHCQEQLHDSDSKSLQVPTDLRSPPVVVTHAPSTHMYPLSAPRIGCESETIAVVTFVLGRHLSAAKFLLEVIWCTQRCSAMSSLYTLAENPHLKQVYQCTPQQNLSTMKITVLLPCE